MAPGLNQADEVTPRTRIALAAALVACAVGLIACRAHNTDADSSNAAVTYARGDIILTGNLVTMDDQLRVHRNARIWIREGLIEAITPATDPVPPELADVPRVTTNGFIYPGLESPSGMGETPRL